jgi:hypothetical protein
MDDRNLVLSHLSVYGPAQESSPLLSLSTCYLPYRATSQADNRNYQHHLRLG